MDFFNLGLSVVLRLINQCLAEAYLGMAVFGGIGLVVGVVLAIVVVHKGLLARKKPLFAFVRTLYPIYFPVLFGLFGATMGGVMFAKSELVSQVPESVTPMVRISFVGYQLFLKRGWEQIEEQQIPFSATVDHFTEGIHYEKREDMDGLLDGVKIHIANSMAPKSISWGFHSVVRSAMTYFPDKELPDEMSSEEYESKALMMAKEADILSYPDEFWNRVDVEIVAMIEAHFSTVYLRVTGIFALLLLLPFIETILNFRRSS